jgi:hypothetical protein
MMASYENKRSFVKVEAHGIAPPAPPLDLGPAEVKIGWPNAAEGEEVRMRNRVTMLGLALGLTLGAQGAFAMSQWWVPTGGKCPAFDTEAACEQWCAGDDKRCQGTGQCESKIGEGERPECNDEP